jgi:hypothetical protein
MQNIAWYIGGFMWVKAKGFESRLEVTRCGRVRSIDRFVNNYPKGKRLLKGRELSCSLAKNGYKYVSMTSKTKQGIKGSNYLLHRIIAETFIPNPLNLETVNHKDGNKTNNCVDNLEWLSNSDNVKHAWDTGLSDGTKKPVIAISDDVCFYYPSINSTAKDGFRPSLVTATCSGRQSNHAGYKWEKVNEPT